MSRFTELQATIPRNGKACWRTVIDGKLTPKQRTELDEALNDLTISAGVLRRVLMLEWKVTDVGDTTIQRHRKGECSCPR